MVLKDTTISLMNSLGSQRIPFLFIISYDGKDCIIHPLKDIDQEEIKYNFNGISNTQPKERISDLKIEATPLSFEQYQEKFDIVKQELQLGNTYLINLTVATPLTSAYTLEDIYHTTKAKYKLLVKNQFTCFSPEIFVQIKDNAIYSYPMKGTIKADIPNASELLLKDKKETAEHYTIVDLIRNDLNIVSKKVRVNRFRYLDKLETSKGAILQMSSEIAGELSTNWHKEIGTIFSKLLPAGSITGSPKESTVNIIAKAEQYDRNYYTGVCGIYDGESVDSAVMIRFIEQQSNQLVYKSGGGITSSSEVEKEYEELLQKIYIPS
ncbi:para-aminobenzoate synthetase component I [Myroides odoratimimus CCUG 12700]|uniref:aminodeoxychorismate synthase component I n=1 Tax=Myroides odoratimimus TaxID=76832 RepID=UPI000352AE53|nr:aminodeoxychorismate synthase component I [Myroides odoratimimus]EPH13774.1 para-aminobenzoate synthetase component I [Myroides odoratimimus CCUG 12700]